MYNDYKLSGFIPLEDIYKWIILNLSFSYHGFRLIVWGSALVLLIRAYKRLDVPYDLCLAIFASVFLIWFSYARVSLAMSMLILGLSYIAKPSSKSKLLSYLIGIGFLMLSEFFHRSAVLGIVAAVGSIFLANLDKKRLIIIGILYPVAIFILMKLLVQFMMVDLDYDTFVSINHRDGYLNDTETGRASRGIGELISDFLTRTPLFLTAFLYVYLIFKGKYAILPKSVRTVASYAFLLIMIGVAFSFDLGFNTYVLYYRTLTFAMIPSAVFLASVKVNHLADRLTQLIINMGVAGVFYALAYAAYCAFVG